MATGKRREDWDIAAAIQLTVLNTAFSRPKDMPKQKELNPIRYNEEDDWDDDENDAFTVLDKKMSKVLCDG